MNLRTCIFGITLGVSLGWAPTPSAWAQSQDAASVKGVPVVVEIRGERKHGADRLSRTLRRALADALGGLRSSRALHREQDRLGISDEERTRPTQLAEAARGVAAEYLVFVRIVRNSRANYEAKGYLIDAKDAQLLHRSIVKYKRPSKEAGDAGVEIAASMLKALGELVATRQPPPPPPPPPIATQIPEPIIEPAVVQPPVSDPDPDPDPEPVVAVAPPVSQPPAVQPPVSAPPATGVERPAPRRKKGPIDLRLGLGGGAGLLRSYQVSADGVSASSLSHSLSPQGLAQLSAEITLNKIGLGLMMQAALRPVGYTLSINGQPQDLSGLLIDARGALAYHLGVGERAGQKIELLPAVGLRVGRSSVEAHSTNVLPSATLMVVFAQVGLRLPYDENLEFEASVDFGAVASYSESPVTTGSSGGGFGFGADLGVHYWVSERIGVAFDTRFTLDRLSFSDRPTRAVTRIEQANLQDANVSITDVRTAASVVFRF